MGVGIFPNKGHESRRRKKLSEFGNSSLESVSFKRCSRKRCRQQQECVRNASEMRPNGSCFIGKRGRFQNASKMRQKCVKDVSKMRGTPLGENTFWTILMEGYESSRTLVLLCFGLDFRVVCCLLSNLKASTGEGVVLYKGGVFSGIFLNSIRCAILNLFICQLKLVFFLV